MPRARHYFEKSLESFKAMDDTAGIYLSWAGIVDTHAFGLDEWKRLDDCIAAFEELKRTRPSFPSRDIDLIASSRMLICLTLRKTDRPHLVHRWLQRVTALLQENPSFDIQMDTLFCMSLYYLWKGEYDRNAVLLERAEAEIRHRKPPPFTVIRFKLMMGIHGWITAEYESALKTLSDGLDISAGSGVHVFDSLLWGFRAAAEMAPGALELAEKSLEKQMASLLDTTKTLDIFFYHINAAWFALLKGNPSLSAEHLESISARTVRMGAPYYRALWHIGMAQTAFLQDLRKDAKAHVRTAARIGLTMKSQVMEWYSLLIEAWFLLAEEKEAEGLLSLHRGLSLGRRHGYAHLEFYLPPVMRFLFAKALAEGIEPEYVKGLIRKLGLTPPNPLASSPLLPFDKEKMGGIIYLEEWPYPIKIYTLGRFEILRDDTPLAFSGKEQKRPLDLLKAMIAFGGVDVPEERLTDALWPDADGDRAALLREKALRLHKGPFLPSDSGLQWAVPSRETLKNRLLRVILKAGRHCEQAGEWDGAADYYAKGIEMDRLAEEFYRRLMVCNLNLGNNADAVTIYNRCSRLLRAELGIEPSSETTAVFSSIMQKR
jgi:tetratricopeptide (TPR) repeat protein